jgi:hypothetical protein
LLQEEIELLLSEAVKRKERVRADEHAERLLQRFPAIELSPDSIADEITAAATYAGVPVENSPHGWSGEIPGSILGSVQPNAVPVIHRQALIRAAAAPVGSSSQS